MSAIRKTPPSRTPNGRWDRFVEARAALAFTWVDGHTQGFQMGTRRGSGTRRIGRNSEVRFTSIDDNGKGWEETDGDSGGSGSGSQNGFARDEEVLLGEHRAASDFLGGVGRGLEEEVGGTVRLRAEVQLYAQRILHETEDRRVTDVRRGAWMEIRADIPYRGMRTARLAGETVSDLLRRGVGSRVGRGLGIDDRKPWRLPVPVGGTFPVVFAAGGCEALLHEIGHQFEEPPVGPWKEWCAGSQVASPWVSIVDDPGRGVVGRGRYRFDDEGVLPRKVVLLEKGRIADRIVNGSFFDARAMDGPGHARRASYRDLPLPRMACTILEPGPDDPHAILADTSKGIFVKRLGSGSTDPESGRVTLSVTEAYLIEKGEITRPIAPSFLISDVASLLSAIDAVGSDLAFDHGATNCVKSDQHLPVIVGLPTIRIGMIRVISPYS